MKRNIFKITIISATLLVHTVAVKAQTSDYNYATGNVTGRNHVGGLIGRVADKDAKVTNSYARGSVTGETIVGGFAGSSNGTIEKSYSTGKIAGNSNSGGFAGSVAGEVNNSYWDMQTSSISTSAAGSGRNTVAMKFPYAAGTYTGWDFNNVWKNDQNPSLNNGYPVLSGSEVYRLDLLIVPLAAGSVSGAGFYKTSQPVQVTADPGELFVFKGWEIGTEIISTQLQYNLPLTKNTTLIARFESKSTATHDNLSLDKSSFILYPNPVNDILWVNVSGLSEKVISYSVINLLGQELININPDSNSGSRISIIVSDLKSGMYLLKADLGNKFMLEKFIKN